jgi:MoxR-like ATPase
MKDRAEIAQALAAAGYIADGELATAISMMALLKRPLLLEGEAGVGKTEVAKALAAVHATELIRLQCYEGLDQSAALYEWNYQRQLLSIQAHRGENADAVEHQIFSEKYLLERPLLAAIRRARPPVLLIDEIDRADDEFEALLLEFLGESAVTVPELGTFVAERPPVAVLTSNRSRDLHDALRRRCLYHWIDYPEPARAAAIVRRTVPGATTALIERATQFVGTTRDLDLDKPPGVAETIDWVAALVALKAADLVDPSAVVSLGALAKTPDDRTVIHDALIEYSRT